MESWERGAETSKSEIRNLITGKKLENPLSRNSITDLIGATSPSPSPPEAEREWECIEQKSRAGGRLGL